MMAHYFGRLAILPIWFHTGTRKIDTMIDLPTLEVTLSNVILRGVNPQHFFSPDMGEGDL